MVVTPIGKNGQNAVQVVAMEPGYVSETARIPSRLEEGQIATVLGRQKSMRHATFPLAVNVSMPLTCVTNDKQSG